MEIIRTALKAITINKMRSFLTMLGVIIGVLSVVLLTSIGTGLQAYVSGQFDALGANSIYVQPGNLVDDNGNLNFSGGGGAVNNTAKFNKKDIKVIKNSNPHITKVIPIRQGAAKASFRDKNKAAILVGSTPDIFPAMNIKINQGRFFTDQEYQANDKVVVLGHNIVQELFGESNAVGKTVKIGGKDFKVVGTALENGNTFGGPPIDNYVYLPLDRVTDITKLTNIDQFMVKVDDQVHIPEVKADIKKALTKSLNDPNAEFSVFDQNQLLGAINTILGALTVGLGGIAAISLVVGGIGIMNIMLVSVTERTREIGLRKALGATPNNILFQFLIESAILSVLGGLIGAGLAILISLVMEKYIPSQVTPEAVILAFTVSLLVGVVFGVAPASRAAKLQPIEALRSE